jgi:hypothetical protein
MISIKLRFFNQSQDDPEQSLSAGEAPKEGDLFELSPDVFYPVIKVWFRPDLETRECPLIVELSYDGMQDLRPHDERTSPAEIPLFSKKS